MPRKNLYMVIGLVVLAALAVAVFYELHLRDNAAYLLDKSDKTLQDQQADKVTDLRAQLEQAKQDEMNNGCVTRQGYQVIYCGQSLERISRLEKELADAIEQSHKPSGARLNDVTTAVRNLRNDQSLQLTFGSRSKSSYAEGPSQTETYRDNKGMQYEVDLYSTRIVQFGPGSNSDLPYKTTPQLSAQQLQEQAETFLNKYVPNFEKVRTSFNFTQETKTGGPLVISFYKWEAKQLQEGDLQKAFVQVGLSPAGEIVSFTDTTIYHNLP